AWVVLGLVAAAVSACAGETDYSVPPERPSCAHGTTVDLGYLSFVGRRSSSFTTRGGEVHFLVSGVDQGGMFDASVTRVYVGRPGTVPVYDEQHGTVGNALTTLQVHDRSYASVGLRPGTYWVTSSNGGHLLVTSCREHGVGPVA
ncbi:MAG TPA: hypothetical protein VNS46_09490, partial [Nocardioides sp.]|nr:hypothetical protein [Nocardioides sp.]